ncbi:hypothetical protein [Streptomyces montanisoli]|uniref:Uncharacterized protein n=1 Tax=Streptomyces montanisoli TaxID=2798581 RepID=A0A940MAP7_9ACTN|nr:hypothetical protein [Streptomyces montanisoli]MBP0457487.1 hypothetical protein [Streptomyces montanisoli]
MDDDDAEIIDQTDDVDVEAPEDGGPDVLLDVPTLNIEEINLEVENLRARVSLHAEVLDLLRLNVGADVDLGRVELDIKGVEAQALLKVRLDNVLSVVERLLASVDRNPQILEHLTSAAASAVRDVGAAGGDALGEVGRGVGDAGREVGRGVGDAGRGLGEAGKGVGESVGQSAEGVSGAVGEGVEGASGAARDTTEGASGAVRDSGELASRAVRGGGRDVAPNEPADVEGAAESSHRHSRDTSGARRKVRRKAVASSGGDRARRAGPRRHRREDDGEG